MKFELIYEYEHLRQWSTIWSEPLEKWFVNKINKIVSYSLESITIAITKTSQRYKTYYSSEE